MLCWVHTTRRALFRRSLADLFGAAERPGQHVDAVRKGREALCAHLPEGRPDEGPLIQLVKIGHCQEVRQMAVHNNRVLWVHIEAGHTAHHVGWNLEVELTRR